MNLPSLGASGRVEPGVVDGHVVARLVQVDRGIIQRVAERTASVAVFVVPILIEAYCLGEPLTCGGLGENGDVAAAALGLRDSGKGQRCGQYDAQTQDFTCVHGVSPRYSYARRFRAMRNENDMTGCPVR